MLCRLHEALDHTDQPRAQLEALVTAIIGFFDEQPHLSDLIQRALDNLKHDLMVEIVIVSLVILVFLWHIPSAIVPIAV